MLTGGAGLPHWDGSFACRGFGGVRRHAAPADSRYRVAKHPEYPALQFAFDPQGIDGRGINTTLYPGASLPMQYVIDHSGKLAAAISGDDGDAKESALEATIRKACAVP